MLSTELRSYYVYIAIIATFLLLPFVSFAQDTSTICRTITGGGLVGLFNCAIGLVEYVIDIIIILAFFYFLWGVMVFIKNAEDQTKRAEGRQRMIWGVVALFVMVSVWGLVQILTNTFGFSSATPGFSTSGGGGGSGGGSTVSSFWSSTGVTGGGSTGGGDSGYDF